MSREHHDIDVPGRAIAALGLCSGAVHIAMAAQHPGIAGAISAALAAACLLCSAHLWNHPAPRTFAATALMALMMLVVHLPAGGIHIHGGATFSADASGAGPPTVTAVAMTFAALEFTASYAMLHLRTRRIPASTMPASRHF